MTSHWSIEGWRLTKQQHCSPGAGVGHGRHAAIAAALQKSIGSSAPINGTSHNTLAIHHTRNLLGALVGFTQADVLLPYSCSQNTNFIGDRGGRSHSPFDLQHHAVFFSVFISARELGSLALRIKAPTRAMFPLDLAAQIVFPGALLGECLWHLL